MPTTKLRCPQCLKLVSETDICDGCDKAFCVECLTYQGEKGSEGELSFCEKSASGSNFFSKKIF